MQLSIEQLLEWIILGIDNGNYQASRDIASDALKQLKEETEKEKQK